MQNHSDRNLVVLSVLLVTTVILTAPTNLAKQLVVPSKQSEKVTTDARAATSSGERILIASGGKIIALDRASKAVLWESSGLRGAYCVAALPGGGFLVGEGKSIAQIDGEGKFVSRAEAVFKLTTDVKPIESGRMLVSDGPAGTVVEMDWSGKIAWSLKDLHYPSEAIRLENGNTLVADGTAELKEFDSAGKKVRGTWVKQWAAAVQRVFGGTLVGESKSVEFLDTDGHVIWSRQIPSRVTGVRQLLSGEYLICEPDARRVAILDDNGNVTWEATGLNYPWRAIYLP